MMIKQKITTILLLAYFCIFSNQLKAQNMLNAEDFGVVMNNTKVDNSAAFQKAIDSAAITGATIFVKPGYIKFNETLVVKAGVTIMGSGRGSTSNQTPNNGTIFWYTGTAAAMQVTGSNVVLNNFTIYDKTSKATDGLVIKASSNLVESFSLTNVLIFGFVNGTALHFLAENHGGIAYSSFYDVRIRHAKIGISITPDGTSFINSNSFYHGVISGGAFDVCLKVEGGNHNIFYGTIIEPYASTYGHVWIEKGQIIGEHIRIESVRQPKETPVVKLEKNSFDCYFTGTYTGGLIVNEGKNNILTLSH
ncbi:MAG: hypothetical protein WCJ62_02840 [Flavobacterium sp.]